MNATINTFPPFQSMNSPRGWILAAIVLLHFGFFVLLSTGMGQRIVEVLRPPPVLVIPQTEHEPEPPPPAQTRVDIDTPHVSVAEPDLPPMPPEPPVQTTTPFDESVVLPPASLLTDDGHGTSLPVTTLPDFDPRIGFSNPLYPAVEIRAGHEGTVMLSVYVLENGRVGEVRLDRSSGYVRLDESALREARRWRFKPGMRDGVPVAMWRQIPVTFRLEAGARF